MDTKTLEAFWAVAESGSFSLAADRLYLTQPAVSKRVAALEEELATKLFERLGRRILLTEAGHTLLPKARHILAEMAQSRQLIADLSADVGGRLQLVTSHHIGLHRLPGILREFSRRYPQVEFDLHFLDSEAGCAAVAAGEVELAVVTLPQEPLDKLDVQPVWEDPLMVMVSRDHALAACSEVVTELAKYRAILPEKGTVTRRLIEQGLAGIGVTPVVGVETNYLETIRMLVSAGLGWSVLPLTILDNDLLSIDLPGVTFLRRLGIVSHRGRTFSRAARAFCDMLLSA
jgi:DNA-binding transcriptional LysR family regulator